MAKSAKQVAAQAAFKAMLAKKSGAKAPAKKSK